MGAYLTVTVELSGEEATRDALEFVADHDDFSRPKRPDEAHVVCHSEIVRYGVLADELESLVRDTPGVSRVGLAHSDDTVDRAHGRVYAVEDGTLTLLGEYDEIDADYGTRGSVLYRKAAHDLGFDLYTWWDHRIEGMKKRYERYVYDSMAEGDWTGDSYEAFLADRLADWDPEDFLADRLGESDREE